MLKKILALSSTTTPALITASYGADPTCGALGIGYGRVVRGVFPIQVVRAAASTMTGVKFKIQVCRDPSAAVWIDIRARLISSATATYAIENTLAAAANTTAEDYLVCDDCESTGALRIVAKAVDANATTGDSCGAWLWI